MMRRRVKAKYHCPVKGTESYMPIRCYFVALSVMLWPMRCGTHREPAESRFRWLPVTTELRSRSKTTAVGSGRNICHGFLTDFIGRMRPVVPTRPVTGPALQL